MYKELDKYIKAFEKDSAIVAEYWNDDGVDKAIEMFNNFKDKDWEELSIKLPEKSSIWKKRFVLCLTDRNDKNRETLQSLSYTDDIELFSMVISVLNKYDIDVIENKEYLYQKIDEVLPKATEIEKMYLHAFLEK